METGFLADHRDSIPTLARWIFEEWSYLHPQRTLAEVERITAEGCSKERLPISLVAIDDENVVGTVTLKENDFKGRPDLNPWLSGLYVDEGQRRKGIGAKLVHKIEQLAARRGVVDLFLVTDDAVDFYRTLGWQVLEQTEQSGLAVTVMEKNIARFL